MAKILLCEDDEVLAERLSDWLHSLNFVVEHVIAGKEAFDRLRLYNYDLVILDWELPDMAGVDVCRSYRSHGGSTPILMLTGRAELKDKVGGFDAGADDYLTKPFAMQELGVRIRALLRRPPTLQADELSVKHVRLDRAKVRVFRGDSEVHLQPMEYNLLEYMMMHADRVHSSEELLNAVWRSEADATVDSLRTHIKQIRKKIDLPDQPSIIRTVHGQGYIVDS